MCESREATQPDEPFRRIVLEPEVRVTVVVGKFMVEVMISFTKCQYSREDMVPRRVGVGVGLLAEPVSERVDTEGGLMEDEGP